MEDRRQIQSSGREPMANHEPMSPQEEVTLSRLFYRPRTGFMNSSKLSKKARLYPALAQTQEAQVKDWYWKQPVNQVMRKVQKPKVYTSITGEAPGTNMQMDFLIYRDHSFHKFKYILCVIDNYSRRAWAFPTTNRKGPTYTRLFEQMVQEDLKGVWPKHLNCDNEFIDGEFARMLNDHGTTVHYSEVGESNKNSLVERFIRTLRGMIAKATWAWDQPDWPMLIPQLVENYNNSYHRTIQARPMTVFQKQEPSNQILRREVPDLEPGDKVRLKLKRTSPFIKGDKAMLSEETYILDHKEGTLWKIRNEETGELVNRLVKVKDFKKEGEVWTTARKDIEKQVREEQEKEQAAVANDEQNNMPQQQQEEVSTPMVEEAEQQEKESGGDDHREPEIVVPPLEDKKAKEDAVFDGPLPTGPRVRLRQQEQRIQAKRRMAPEKKRLGDYLDNGVKQLQALPAKRQRVPSKVNRDLGYEEKKRR